MELTLEQANQLMNENGGWLNLRNTGITKLPEELAVGSWLNLNGTAVTTLPEGLTVGGWLSALVPDA